VVRVYFGKIAGNEGGVEGSHEQTLASGLIQLFVYFDDMELPEF